MMEKEKQIERSIIFYAWGYALVGTIILLIGSAIWNPDNIWYLPISFILGVCTNLMCFTLNVKVVDFVLNNNIKNAKPIMIGVNLVKLLMYAIVLAISVLVDNLEIFSCFFGMLSVKLMIYFKSLVVDKIREKKKNKSSNQNIVKDGDDLVE